jgi:predicted enzyme related to lactoylglutathione lyase
VPKRDGYEPGVPCWVDLTTNDLEGAKSFYSALFGWEYEHHDTDTGPYALASQKGEAATGMFPGQGDVTSVWTTYIAVDDVDAAAKRISEEGGRILMEPLDVTDTARMAIASDPTGAVFGIWEAGTHIGARIVNEHGALNWNELITDQLETALDFYRLVFGYQTKVTETPGGRDYHMLEVGGRGIAGAIEPPAPGIPNHWGVYFAVDDIARAEKTAKENGGAVVYGPMEAPGVGTLLGMADPYGAQLTLIQLAAPVD